MMYDFYVLYDILYYAFVQAPEMLLLLSEFYPESSGYSYSVDYWSLGITIYRLLTGKIPFTDSQVSTFLPYIRNNNKSVRENPPTDDTNFLICNSESKDENSDSSSRHSRNLPLVYATFLSKLQLIHAFASQSSIQIITKLLEIDEKKRLGSSLSELKAEPFFHGIDWGLLIQKKVSPPVLPLPVVTSLNAEDLQALNEGVGSVKAKDGYFSFSASTLAAGANSGSQVRIGKSFTQVMEEMMDPPENSKFNKHSVIVTKNDDIGETEQGYFDSW